MQNSAFLPSVPSSLSTITTMTTAAGYDSECGTPISHGGEFSSPLPPTAEQLSTRFYIGEESSLNQASPPPSKKAKFVTILDSEESESLSDAITAATALMNESTKRMANQNSFDSGYGIVSNGGSGHRFLTCDSEAAIVLNPEVVASGGHDSGCDDDSFASTSGSFTNGTFGKIRLFSVVAQVFLAIVLSSAGNFGAGIILDKVQNWTVFHRVPELFYLVPALLGLKGNLEMTMVARLSTQANMGRLNTWKRTLRCMAINISLVQCQAIVISFLASSVTFLVSIYENNGASSVEAAGHLLLQPGTSDQTAGIWIETTDNGAQMDVTADIYTKVLVIFSTSLATANAACLGSSIFMILMIVLLTNMKINPDNFATAIAASIGDIVTSFLLGVIGQYIFSQTVYLPTGETGAIAELSVRFYQDLRSPYIAIGVILFFIVIFPGLAYITCQDEANKKVLFGVGAWCPILIAMMVSFFSGFFLRVGAKNFSFMALFQPLINGVGGNLAAITSSRLSTEMHVQSSTRASSINGSKKGPRKSYTRIFSETVRSFLKPSDKQNALLLIFVVISLIIQVIYGLLLPLQNGHFGQITALFYILYCFAACLQVLILLTLTRFLVNAFWYRGMDPDTCAIPLLTSLGDLLGTVFLLSVFYTLQNAGDISALPAEVAEQTLVSSGLAASIHPSGLGDALYATVNSLEASEMMTTTTTTMAPLVLETTTNVAKMVLKQAAQSLLNVA